MRIVQGPTNESVSGRKIRPAHHARPGGIRRRKKIHYRHQVGEEGYTRVPANSPRRIVGRGRRVDEYGLVRPRGAPRRRALAASWRRRPRPAAAGRSPRAARARAEPPRHASSSPSPDPRTVRSRLAVAAEMPSSFASTASVVPPDSLMRSRIRCRRCSGTIARFSVILCLFEQSRPNIAQILLPPEHEGNRTSVSTQENARIFSSTPSSA